LKNRKIEEKHQIKGKQRILLMANIENLTTLGFFQFKN
jgi:hypothetical protein